MKILYYSPHPHLNLASPSGYGTHMREMINAFREHGHDVKVFIAGGTKIEGNNLDIKFNSSFKKRLIKDVIPSIIWEGIKDIKFLLKDKKLKSELRYIVNKWKPDLIYERGIYLMTSGVEVAKETGVRHILEMNAPYLEEKISFNGKSVLDYITKRKEKQQVFETNFMVVVSSSLKKHFENKYSSLENNIKVIPNAINPQNIKLISDFKINFLTENISSSQLIIGFVGSISPYHGVDRLIRVFNKLQKNIDNISLVIVGDGEILSNLKAAVAEMGIMNKVLFTGNVHHSEVFNYISEFDIAVMASSNWYGSPVKIFEYGAMGKAIIAPDLVPLRDVIQNGKDALLVLNSDLDFEEKLQELIHNEEMRNKIGESFKQKVYENYTWSKAGKKVLDLLCY